MTKFVVYSRHTLRHYSMSVTTDCECSGGKPGYKCTENIILKYPK